VNLENRDLTAHAGDPQAERLVEAARRLAKESDALRFALPVTHVYNPLLYAWAPHEAYIRRYAASRKRVVFVGMNPGPWGMAQTGVPFGEVGMVRNWMGIEGPVGSPASPHPKRPIEGFRCTRSEVSGRRLWGWARDRFGEASAFFADHFVANYCPLAFIEESGRNRTPDHLPAAESGPLFALCDRHLAEIARALEPSWLIGIGKFAAGRVEAVVAGLREEATGADRGRLPATGAILHPSPASPLANRGWEGVVTQQLRDLGVWQEHAI